MQVESISRSSFPRLGVSLARPSRFSEKTDHPLAAVRAQGDYASDTGLVEHGQARLLPRGRLLVDGLRLFLPETAGDQDISGAFAGLPGHLRDLFISGRW
jgi:hypothetical protein